MSPRDLHRRRGLLDTSVFIAGETGRALEVGRMPEEAVISPITIGELEAGVLAATDVDVRARRLATLDAVSDIELLPVDAAVAAEWARLRVHLVAAGRRINVNDLWIAATAAAHGLPVVMQDADFSALEGIAGVSVIQV